MHGPGEVLLAVAMGLLLVPLVPGADRARGHRVPELRDACEVENWSVVPCTSGGPLDGRGGGDRGGLRAGHLAAEPRPGAGSERDDGGTVVGGRAPVPVPDPPVDAARRHRPQGVRE
jgi:hypothetical protein